MNGEVKDIRERIVNGFSINRIPDKTKNWFIDFAHEEFCDDRGMLLKHLVDFYIGLIPSGVEHLELAINELQEELDALKKQIETKKEEPKVRNRLDGSIIEEKKNG